MSRFCKKSTVFYFKKLGIPRSTIYRILAKYAKHKQTCFLPKSGRPTKVLDKKLKILVKAVNNKTDISQCRLGQFGIAQLCSLKVYRLLKPDVYLIMDDEKYFSLTGDINSNRFYYSTEPSTTPYNVKFKCRMKFEPKLMVWICVSQKGISNVSIHRSKGAICTETYLNECIRKRLIPFINKFHRKDSLLFWPDLAIVHYAQEV